MLAFFVYVFLLCQTTVVVYSSEDSSSCPSFVNSRCTCSSEMIDCSGQQLSSMVEKTEESIRTLDLSNNLISKTVVVEAPSLIYLSLANNKLKNLRYDTFDNLDELKTLVLSNNLLTRITDDVFEWNPLKLEVLRLDGNEIEFIQHFLFYDLEQLTELDMSNNKITFIHPHAFAQMKKLTKLNLSRNHLHTFDSKWFKGLSANMFTEMDLSGNRWSCDCTMGNQTKWLSSKKAKWFFKALSSKLVCMQPPAMKGKEVKSITAEKNLECSPPHITGISQSTTLYVGQSIELDCVLKNDSFPVASVMWIAPNHDHYSLQTADRFEGIEVFQNGTMIIHKVKIDDAGIYKCVASNHKSSVQASTTLTIKAKGKNNQNNYVEAIERNATNRENTKIAVDKHCPEKCKCLSQHVDCSPDTLSDKITVLDYSLLPNNTVSVSYALNAITTVPPSKTKFTLLTELRLDDNSITTIAKHAFDNLDRLQTLTLRNNKLTVLHRKLFRRLTKLNILVLDDNELTAIDDDMFYGLLSLQWIYIRHNLIKSITSSAFAQLPKVKFIHLENNEISTIFPQTITALTSPKDNHLVSIKKIFVDENPFMCDCEMNGLRIYLKENEQWENLFGDGVRCNFPPRYNGMKLVDVHETLPCDKPFQNVTTVGGPAAGKHCHFPFEYNGHVYSKCIAVHDNKVVKNNVWCSTAESFDEQNWGICPSAEYVGSENKNESGAMSGLWFAGLIVGLVLCVVGFVLWKKYGRKLRSKSVRYSDLPRDDMDEYQSLTSGNRGSEAYV